MCDKFCFLQGQRINYKIGNIRGEDIYPVRIARNVIRHRIPSLDSKYNMSLLNGSMLLIDHGNDITFVRNIPSTLFYAEI